MGESSFSTAALLGELADTYDRCNLTAESLARLLSNKASIQLGDASCCALEPVGEQAFAGLAAATGMMSTSSRAGPAVPDAAPPQLLRSRSLVDKRQQLTLGRCDLPQINLRSVGPAAGARLDDFSSNPAWGGGSSPGSAGTPRSSQQQQHRQEIFRRTSIDFAQPSSHSRRNSFASQQPAAAAAAPPLLDTPPPPMLLRGRSLQRYDSNPGVSYDDDFLLSQTASEALAGRLSEKGGVSPRVSASGLPQSRSGRFVRSQSSALPSSPSAALTATAATLMDGGVDVGSAAAAPRSPAGGGCSGGGSPLVPTPPPPGGSRGGLPTSARGFLFLRSRRSMAGTTSGVAPLTPFSGEGRNSRSSSSSGVGHAPTVASTRSTLAAVAAATAAAGGINSGTTSGGPLQSAADWPPPLQLPSPAASPLQPPLASPLLTFTPPPRRSFQGLPPGRSSSSSRMSTSEWLMPTGGIGGPDLA